VNFLLFVAAVFCAVRFVSAGDGREILLRGVGMLLAFQAVTAVRPGTGWR
jgi:hypothetical protein